MRRRFPLFVAAALLAAWPAAAQPILTSVEQQRAYLVGVSNVISVGAAWDAKNAPGAEQTFSRTAQRALKHSNTEEAIRLVDSWYRANPTQLSKPVLSVVWREIAKPQFPPAK